MSNLLTNLHGNYHQIRQQTLKLCDPLTTEDYVVQSIPDVSPTKWHLGHTSWFFETFVLKKVDDNYREFNLQFQYLFNSYYNSVGKQYPRAQRGLLSRPAVDEVKDYRAYVDEKMDKLLSCSNEVEIEKIIELGLHHEQQHQELLLMDIKHVFSCNPLYPAYSDHPPANSDDSYLLGWISYNSGSKLFGKPEDNQFGFDNESPQHQQLLESFQLANRLITNGEYLEFIEDQGYQTPILWLADGWKLIDENHWQAPLYWVKQKNEWFEFTLYGLKPLNLSLPVCHLSYYEADAFASWFDARLPSEYELEHAYQNQAVQGNFLDHQKLHPIASKKADGIDQLFGDVWEWTKSPYMPYPGYKANPGALGEYNGKFMCNQYVMRGGSCLTNKDHFRKTYRNFFYPHMRWQMGGLRLARDL